MCSIGYFAFISSYKWWYIWWPLSETIGTDLTHEWRWWLEFPQRKWTGNEDRDGRPEMRERLRGEMCSPGASGAWGLDFRWGKLTGDHPQRRWAADSARQPEPGNQAGRHLDGPKTACALACGLGEHSEFQNSHFEVCPFCISFAYP